MDFFEHQDLARKNSRKLIVLFVLAVIGVVLSVYLLLGVAVTGYGFSTDESSKNVDAIALLTDWRILLMVGGGTLLFVGGASAYRISSLQGGGQTVAASLGGRPLQQNTTDRDERRLLNVVEEMAIASGTPVPPVFLLEEQGINAFAAGYSPQDAVIGVTRGCVQSLSRDELQGVIAHEFSHILNGDMRMSIRLIGIIYGIMAIGFIGWQIFRIAIYSGAGRRSSKDSSVPMIAIGAGLIAIGAVGTFFGNWIKASFSRQREYLADSSAVQFTRNPQGISGALMQIGASPAHGQIESPNASEFSHMYFAMGVSTLFSGIFATHPPLEKRILRIEPRWDGKYPKQKRTRKSADTTSTSRKDDADSRKQKVAKAVTILAGVEAIGQPTPSHLALAHELISEIPDAIKEAARNPYGARAVVYALLLNLEPPIRQHQLAQLKQNAERGLAEMTQALASEVSRLDRKHRLPLIEMTLGSLKLLSTTQYENFMSNLDALAKADSKIELFEWVVLRVVHHHLGPPKRSRTKYHGLEKLSAQCNLLLSILAWAGHTDPNEVQAAFDLGAKVINIPCMALVPRDNIDLVKLGDALDILDSVDLRLKKTLISAAAQCIIADQQVTPDEAELMRAIADSFGCPMPPLLPGQALV